MLKFLLGYDDFFRKSLFPKCLSVLDKESIVTEKVYTGRNRIDIEAQSSDGNYVLIIENKFKSFPTADQLKRYDHIYNIERNKAENSNKKFIKYIVCFDEKIVQIDNHEWNILAYSKIKDILNEYIDNNKNLQQDIRLFFEHYAAYLNNYYKAYDAVFKNYSYAFSDNIDELYKISPKLKDKKFWQRLVLFALGNDFIKRCRKNNMESFEVEFDDSSTTVAFLDILPQHWNKAKSPFLFIQMQGEKFKLFMRELPKDEGQAEKDKLLNYIEALQKNTPDEAGNIKPTRLQGHLEHQKKSFMIYFEDVDTNISVHELGNKLWNFVTAMDNVVKKTGFFQH
jgi:hypothetical protein